jgi:hypothetical protein
MIKVAIIGGGISSMYAALACRSLDIRPDVYVKQYNVQYGAVYLRHLTSEIEERLTKYSVKTIMTGNRQAYIRKQWSSYPTNYSSSFPEKESDSVIFSPKEAIDLVLNDHCRIIKCNDFDDFDLRELSNRYDFVFHSFPTERTRELFRNYMIRIPIIAYEGFDGSPNVVSYDGHPGSIFTRISILFGMKYLEITPRAYFGEEELKELFPGGKVSFVTDLTPWTPKDSVSFISDKIIPIGRLATGNRSHLGEDTHRQVLEILNENI